MYKKSVSR